jgi:NAD(P)-dependent dehydrogenase (short-subunit alcohol dehydrogenase family)
VRFADSIIVITGVGREEQVGDAVAHAFAAEGASLALLDLNAEALNARAAALRAANARVSAYPCDLTDVGQVTTVAERVRTDLGRIDAFVHVAGGFALSGPIGDSDPAIFAKQIAINLTTAYVASRAFVPLLKDNTGSALYFASAVVLPGSGTSGLAGYAAAKSGVVGLMRAVADEGKARGVRANAIAPIAIRTGDNLRVMGDKTKYVERHTVADVVLYLSSPAARAITGQVIALG